MFCLKNYRQGYQNLIILGGGKEKPRKNVQVKKIFSRDNTKYPSAHISEYIDPGAKRRKGFFS